jgi:hypothetical protein
MNRTQPAGLARYDGLRKHGHGNKTNFDFTNIEDFLTHS